MAVYATVSEYESFAGLAAGTAPAATGRLLQRASEFIDARVAAYYEKDQAGAFKDAGVASAFKNATMAQVEWWLATGDEKQATAAYKISIAGGLHLHPSGRRLAPRAKDYLLAANLGSGVLV